MFYILDIYFLFLLLLFVSFDRNLKEKGYQDYTSNLNIEEGKITDIDAQLKEEIKYVDMGLSVYWATCNIGADSPSDFGDFYAWGETEPKSRYIWENYTYGDSRRITKYNRTDRTKTLNNDDDVARKVNGEGWHIPTLDEWIELQTKCIWQWSYNNDVRGYKVTAPNGNSIFLPAAGYYYGSQGYMNKGIAGEYWTNTMRIENPKNAVNIRITGNEYKFYESSRCCGLSIRPVLKKEYGYSSNSISNTEEENQSKIDDNEKINMDNCMSYPYPRPKELVKVEERKPLSIAEKMPSFKGNVNEWLAQHLHIPAVAAENGVQGRVVVRFIVGKDGSISQVSVIRSVDPALDREAIRCVNTMPKWNPGYDKGEPAAVWFTLPVTFKLQ